MLYSFLTAKVKLTIYIEFLNTQHSNIEFTFEKKVDNKI